MNNRIILIIVIAILVCYGVGYTVGYGNGIIWCVRTGFEVVDINLTELGINEEMFYGDLMKYKGYIGLSGDTF